MQMLKKGGVVIRSNELSAIFPMHDVLIFFQLKFVDSMVMTVDLTYGQFNSWMFRSFNLNASLGSSLKGT